jgi:hypothetical protein
VSRPQDEKVVETTMKAHLIQIDRQAEIVLMAFQAMGDELPALTGLPNGSPQHRAASLRFWLNAQALLTAAGILSKILWPPDLECHWRGDELRERLGVPDDSPLRHRTMRNHFDHFDHRVDAWARTPGRVIYLDSVLGDQQSMDAHVGEPVPPEKLLRRYDAMTHTLHFAGDGLHVPTLIYAIEDIRSTVTGQPPTRIVSTGLHRAGKPLADGTDMAPDPEEST